MNDILCQKCNAKQSKNNLEFSTFYKCQICENTCCINCMYLCCSICNKEFICFWCGTDFKHSNNISITEKINLKCKKCMYAPEDYEYDKNKIIKLSENNIKSKNGKNIYNKLWNIDTWDVCFSSSYGFPNNKMGFCGQYYLPKLSPFVDYLTNIGNIDQMKIRYKKISDTDCVTLEKLFEYTKPKKCICESETSFVDQIIEHFSNHRSRNREYRKKCNLCFYVEKKECKKIFNKKNIIKNLTNNDHNNFIFGKNGFKFKCIDDVYNFRSQKLHMFHEANKIENIITMLNLLEEHFLNEYPFFTFYLPENIKEFEDFIVIMDDGNYCEIIARSKDYFYHFQKYFK